MFQNRNIYIVPILMYIMETKMIRLKMSTFKKLTRVFYPHKDESMQSYFNRLAIHLKTTKEMEIFGND